MAQTTATRGKTVDMTEGAIWRILVTFTIPLLLGNLFQLLYNTVDSIVVGHFVGTSALAAVGATTRICNTLVKFFNGVSVGAGAVISRYFGAKDWDHFHRAIQTTMFLTMVACVLFTAVGLIGSDWVLRAISTREDVFNEASLYLRIYFAGISGLLIYNMGSAILRAVGNTRYPLIFLLLCSGMNIMLDLVFVILFHWGIGGVAIATILSQMVSALLVLFLLTHTQESYRVDWRSLYPDRTLTAQIFQIGLPVGIQQSLIAFSNVFVQKYLNAFDTACVAGWNCYSKLDQYMFVPIQSMGQATTTFVGQNLGDHKPERAKKGTAEALGITLAVSSVTAVIIFAFAPQLTRLFSTDEAVIRYGAQFVRLCSPFVVLCSFNQVFSGTLRAAGHSKVPMLITFVTHVFLRQIYLYVISGIYPDDVTMIAVSYPMGWVLCSVVISAYYLLSHWDRRFQVETVRD